MLGDQKSRKMRKRLERHRKGSKQKKKTTFSLTHVKLLFHFPSLKWISPISLNLVKGLFNILLVGSDNNF